MDRQAVSHQIDKPNEVGEAGVGVVDADQLVALATISHYRRKAQKASRYREKIWSIPLRDLVMSFR